MHNFNVGNLCVTKSYYQWNTSILFFGFLFCVLFKEIISSISTVTILKSNNCLLSIYIYINLIFQIMICWQNNIWEGIRTRRGRPVDNRPSINLLKHYVNNKNDKWHENVTQDMYHMTHDIWHMTGGGMWTFSKISPP